VPGNQDVRFYKNVTSSQRAPVGKNRREGMKTGYIALGANATSPIGPPSSTLIWALKTLAEHPVVIRSVSRFFVTPCFPAGAGPDYVNAACAVRWAGSAPELMALLHRIESAAARQRVVRWGQRTLDLDLVALGAEVWPDAATQTAWRDLPSDLQILRAPEHLVVPHPRVQDRGFVLEPLNDIAPHWRHPLLQCSVAEMLAARPPEERADIVPLTVDVSI